MCFAAYHFINIKHIQATCLQAEALHLTCMLQLIPAVNLVIYAGLPQSIPRLKSQCVQRFHGSNAQEQLQHYRSSHHGQVQPEKLDLCCKISQTISAWSFLLEHVLVARSLGEESISPAAKPDLAPTPEESEDFPQEPDMPFTSETSQQPILAHALSGVLYPRHNSNPESLNAIRDVACCLLTSDNTVLKET